MDDKALRIKRWMTKPYNRYNCFLFFGKPLNQPLGKLLERKKSIACAEKGV